jgi:uncharacterized protein YlxP (DUF503 family)
MYVGVAAFELQIEGAESLKDKRMVVRSARDRILSRFDVSIAEVALQDVHQRARLGIAAVSSDATKLESLMQKIESFVENEVDARLLGWSSEVMKFEDTGPVELPEAAFDGEEPE